MNDTDAAYRFATGLAGGLEALGVRRAHLSPGSRSTPLALAFATTKGIESSIHLDERSSAFAAVGSARATGIPVVLACTSGTAAAEYLPAVVEADLARVPLVVVTADRPGELIGVGAPQAIDQRDLYGTAVRLFYDVGEADEHAVANLPSLLGRVWAAATGNPPGPVHVNVRFREPLSPPASLAPSDVRPTLVHHGLLEPTERALADVAALIDGRRALMVAGAVDDPAFASACARTADHIGVPVVSDPQSGLRSATSEHVVRTGDLLAQAGWLDAEPPETVIRIGALPTSKAMWRWLETHPEVTQVFIEPAGWRDPLASSSLLLRADPTATVNALAKLAVVAEGGFDAAWRSADRRVESAVRDTLATLPFPNEPQIARTVVESAPAESIVYVGSSMPIRDVDAYGLRPAAGVRIIANRGANGIDGLLSSAIGAAAASGRPTSVLAGDLSALHDLTALAAARRLGVPLSVVIVDNDGGGIFHFLPQARTIDPGTFERLFGTPHGTDFVAAAQGLGVKARTLVSRDELSAFVQSTPDEPGVGVLSTNRERNVSDHRAVVDAVRAALEVG